MMLNKFLQSTRIDYQKWISGTGYDLIALRYLQPEDKIKIEKMIIRRKNKNWRDIEALDVLGTENSINAITESLQSENIETKFEAGEKLFQRDLINDQQIENMFVGLLWSINYRFRLIKFEKFIFDHQSPIIHKMLLWNTVYGHRNVRFRFAAMLFYLFKISDSPINNYPDYCVDFHSKNLTIRKTAFVSLCHDLNIDPINALDGMPSMTMVAKSRKTTAFIAGGFILFILILTVIADILLKNALK